jgi:hypothetical protein
LRAFGALQKAYVFIKPQDHHDVLISAPTARNAIAQGQRPGGFANQSDQALKRVMNFSSDNSAPSALITFWSKTWAVGPGYFISRLWRFAKGVRFHQGVTLCRQTALR